VADVRQGRAGIPISVKLVLATSIVVAAAVAASTFFAQRTTDELTAMQVEQRRSEGERAITRESELIVTAVANAVALPLANHTYDDIKLPLDAALRDDKASGDRRVQWLVVTDDSGQVVQATDGAPTGPKLAELDRALTDAGGGSGSGSGKGDGIVHARNGSDWVYGSTIKLASNKVGGLRMGVTTAGLDAVLAKSIADAGEKAAASRQRVLMVAAVVLIIGVILAALQGVQLAKPIKTLTVQAGRIAAGDLKSRVQIGRRDELGVLATTFNFMADQIGALLVEQSQKASLEKEMNLAREVQQAMLPPHTLDEHGFLKVVGYCMPASSCGGDWWTYRKLSAGRMLLVLGDATGHGIHSAMIAATARGAVEALSSIDERLLTSEGVLRAIDCAIREVGDHNVLMTAFAAVFDSNTGVLQYANAGQNFPYVIKLGQTKVLEEASIIAASGNPLGDRNINVEIRRGSLQLRAGDLFVCFTDGVVERANQSGKLFGDRRLRSALTGQPLPDSAALVALRDRLVATLDQYAEGTMAQDDITFVLCQFDPAVAPQRLSRASQGAA
jgi:serine phosphatase RsbU (regulator of sigma subunit)